MQGFSVKPSFLRRFVPKPRTSLQEYYRRRSRFSPSSRLAVEMIVFSPPPFRRPAISLLASLAQNRTGVDIYASVVQAAEEIMKVLSSESMSIPLADVTQFSNLTKALRREIKRGFRSGEYGDAKVLQKHRGDIACLFRTLKNLLKKLDECFVIIGDFMAEKDAGQVKDQLIPWTNILVVLSCCNRVGKTFQSGTIWVHDLSIKRRVPVNALTRFARRNVEHQWLLKHKDVTDSEARRSLAMMLFPGLGDESHCPQFNLLIDRSQLFAESFMQIGQVDAPKLHGGISVQFKDEEATGPDVTKEWFLLLFREIFSPKNALFLPCPHDKRRFYPNLDSYKNPKHLEHFRFAGRLVALALRHEIQVGITFDPLFFKLILIGMDVSFEVCSPFTPKQFCQFVSDYETIKVDDLKDHDPVLHASLKFLLEMDVVFLDSDVLGLKYGREFEVQGARGIDEFGDFGVADPVNSHNREDFVDLYIASYAKQVSEQVYHFAIGFKEMFFKKCFGTYIFDGLDYKDFDKMLCGSEDGINVKDWKAHTVYEGYSDEDQQIISFWKVVEGMLEQQRRTLLFFWTSIKVLPLEGFSGLDVKLRICNTFDIEEQLRLPTSMTDFYRLLLPPYSSVSIMHDKLQSITQYYFSETFC